MKGRPEQAAPKRRRPIKCALAKNFFHKERPTGHFARAFPIPHLGQKNSTQATRVEFEFFSYRQRRVWEGSYCNGSATRLLTPHKIANAAAQLARKRASRRGNNPPKDESDPKRARLRNTESSLKRAYARPHPNAAEHPRRIQGSFMARPVSKARPQPT